MALLNKLKSLLGLDDGGSSSDRQRTDDVGVTVEHQPETDEETPPATPAPGSESAEPEPAEVNGSSDASTGPEIEPEVDSPPTEDGHEKSPEEIEGRGSMAESEPEPSSGPATDAEPADTEPADAERGESLDSAGTGSTAEAADGSEIDSEQSIREIKGIGPSYATKLSEAGVDSASDLASADAGELSTSTGLSEKRIQGWIDRAQTE